MERHQHSIANDRRSNSQTELLSQQGQVVRALAGELLSTTVGNRLARIQEYAARFGASVGTVQAALSYLQSAGAATLEARGRLGTFATALDYPRLWTFASHLPVAGVLPLPYSRRFEGLATALREAWTTQHLALDLRFVRGSSRRLEALAARQCDWALVSRFAAQGAHAHGFDVDLVMTLGAHTYMGRHVVLTTQQGGLRDGMRVGVDMDSTDHVVSVRAATRGLAVEWVPIEYSRGFQLLRRGEIDATVWSEEDIPEGETAFITTPLDTEATPMSELGEAALVVGAGNLAMHHLLLALLDPAALIQTQYEVVERLRLPSY